MPSWAETALRQLLALAPELVRAVRAVRGRCDEHDEKLRRLRRDVDRLAEQLARVQAGDAARDAKQQVQLDELARELRED